MANFKEKISNLIESQVPDFILSDHPKFLQFLKTYYTFMEAAELSVTSVQTTDGITLETETNQQNELLLDGTRIDSDRTVLDVEDKILLESSTFGKFTRGELIQGQTSKAITTVLTEDLNNNRLFIVSQDKFLIGETILGLSSNASAIVNNYKPNPVNNIQELLNFRDPDKVISNFLTNFRKEFLATLPENLYESVNKRNLIKNIKSIYQTKGTVTGHKLFFKLLFNEDSDTFFPRENLLRASDGKFSTEKIIRVVNVNGSIAGLIGRSIRGKTSSTSAIVENVKFYIIGTDQVAEITINKESLLGNFTVGEIIEGTATDTDDTFITATITGIPVTKNISIDGAIHTISEPVEVIGGGSGAIIQIKTLGNGGIKELIIDTPGVNYTIGDDLVFNNANTNGGGAAAFVSVVNGGFTPEDSTSVTEDHIILEGKTTEGDTYAGNKFVQETSTGVRDVTDIYLYSEGSNYTSLPTVTIQSSTGSGAFIKAWGGDIGRILDIELVEPGINHQLAPTPPTLKFRKNLILTGVIGTYVVGETVTITGGITAIVTSFNASLGLLTVKDNSAVIGVGTGNKIVVGSTSGAAGHLYKATNATGTLSVGAVADTDGKFTNEDGFVSEFTMKIQDSLLYQDFSYVIKVGRSISDWRNDFKKTMHTAGFYLASQVEISNRLNARITTPITGATTGVVDTPLFSIVDTLFTTIFGRRLGTNSDGTTLRVNAQVGASSDLDTTTISQFSNTTRDLTLSRLPINIAYLSRPRGVFNNINVTQGFVYAGPRYGTINREVLRTFVRQPGTNYSIATLTENTTFGTRTSLDGEDNTLAFTATDLGRLVKTKLTIPSEIFIILPLNEFDNTIVTFDQTIDSDSNPITFDDTTP
jgi:hypothetical protein